MFWYQQFPNQSLILMATSNMGSSASHEQGFPQDSFPISHPNLTYSALTVASARPEHSGLYFCAASDTALGRHQRPRQEPLPHFPAPSPRSPVEGGVEGGKPQLI